MESKSRYRHNPAFARGKYDHEEGIRRGQNHYASGDSTSFHAWLAGWDEAEAEYAAEHDGEGKFSQGDKPAEKDEPLSDDLPFGGWEINEADWKDYGSPTIKRNNPKE